MNTTAAHTEADHAAASNADATAPLTIDHVVRSGNQALAFVRDFPWVGLGVVSTCLGVLILFAYFRGMGHVPADLSTILATGVGIAGISAVYALVMLVALICPHFVYKQMESLRTAPWRPWRGPLKDANNLLIGAQLLSAGVFFSYLTWGLWRTCTPGLEYVLAPAVILVVPGLGLLIHAGWRRGIWQWRTTLGLLFLLALAVLPLLALSGLFLHAKSGSEWDYLLWLVLWLLFILFLGALPKEAPLWAVALVVPVLLPMALWVAPALRGHADVFPQRVMELAGIRTPNVVELQVPRATCELIAATARLAPGGQSGGACGTQETPWVTVRAQVLSNLGTRWWVEVQQVGDAAVDPAEVLRMSIPADGVQLVQRRPAATPTRRSQCDTSHNDVSRMQMWSR